MNERRGGGGGEEDLAPAAEGEVGDEEGEGRRLQADHQEDRPPEGHRVIQEAARRGPCRFVSKDFFRKYLLCVEMHRPTKAPKAKTEVQRPETSP